VHLTFFYTPLFYFGSIIWFIKSANATFGFQQQPPQQQGCSSGVPFGAIQPCIIADIGYCARGAFVATAVAMVNATFGVSDNRRRGL